MESSIRTLSQLPEVTNLNRNSYFETSVPGSVSVDLSGGVLSRPVYRYVSRKISKTNLANSLGDEIRDKLCADTGIPNDNSKNFGKLYIDANKLMSGDFTLTGTKTFKSNPKHTDGITNFETSDQTYSVNLSALKRYTNQNAAPAIGSGFGFVTQLSNANSSRIETLFNIDRTNKIVYNSPRYVFSPESAKIISENEYIFKIDSGERESKEWKAPASGIFTCYGWLDEINDNSVSNEKRWVALLGYQSQLRVWTTLQVQPFIKNNYLSYVGFTFPVHKGMRLKIQTGFPVGNNSDKYFRSSSSLANHLANAFLGGIYTSLSVDFENLGLTGNYSVSDDPRITDLSSALCSFLSHEISCDISTSNRLDELESRLATNDVVEYLSGEIDNRVRFIDTKKYQRAPRSVALRMYNRMFNWNSSNASNYDSSYKQWVIENGVENKNAKLYYHSLDEIVTNSFRQYYAPPEHSEEYGDIEDGVVERAYYTRNVPPLGEIFSDGKYMFYCVSQDCTAIVRMHGDFTSRGASGVAGYMILPYYGDQLTSNIGAVTIGKNVEWIGNLTDPQSYISLPVKAGTIFMFYTWHTEHRDTTAAGKAYPDGYTRKLDLALNATAVVPNADGQYTTFGSLYSRNEYVNPISVSGKDYEYKTYAVWTSDQNQRDKLVDPNGTTPGKFSYLFGNESSHGPDVGGTIATVLELPY